MIEIECSAAAQDLFNKFRGSNISLKVNISKDFSILTFITSYATSILRVLVPDTRKFLDKLEHIFIKNRIQ